MRQIKLICLVAIPACFFSLQTVRAQNPVIRLQPALNEAVYAVSLHCDDKMDAQHLQFFRSNPNVLLLHWKRDGRILQIYLRENIVEQYDLLNKAEVTRAEKIYGKLPPKAGGSYSL